MSDFKVGDVIKIGPSSPVNVAAMPLPKELADKAFWRVRAIPDAATIELDGPYRDEACVVKWHSKPPLTRKDRLR